MKKLILMLAAAGIAPAAIFPGLYVRLQEKAPEYVSVRLVKVTRTVSGGMADIAADAEVLTVQRSKTGLRPGQRIRIAYTAALPSKSDGRFGGCSSPPMPLLSQGVTTVAFLHKREGSPVYGPSAAHLSFTPPVPVP